MTQKVPRVVALVVICILHFVHAFSFTFSSLNNFFFSFFNSKGLIYIPKLVNKKYRSPCSFKSERPSYFRTCLPRQLVEKQCHVLGMRARSFAWLCGFYRAEQDAIQRNHLKPRIEVVKLARKLRLVWKLIG